MDALNGIFCYPERMNNAPLAVLIVEPHPLMRDALTAAIEAEPDLAVAGATETVTQAQTLLAQRPAALLLLALSRGGLDGLARLPDLRRSCPRLRVLALLPWQRSSAPAPQRRRLFGREF